VAGGRNDMECKSKNIPFLDDIHLFLLDQKTWVRVKYIPKSAKICMIGNHSMTVASDGQTYEKIFIFGGIANYQHKT